MIDDVYNAKILAFAGNIPRIGRLDAPMASAKAHSKLCGSTVLIDIIVEDGIRDPLWSRGLGDVYKRQQFRETG